MSLRLQLPKDCIIRHLTTLCNTIHCRLPCIPLPNSTVYDTGKFRSGSKHVKSSSRTIIRAIFSEKNAHSPNPKLTPIAEIQSHYRTRLPDVEIYLAVELICSDLQLTSRIIESAWERAWHVNLQLLPEGELQASKLNCKVLGGWWRGIYEEDKLHRKNEGTSTTNQDNTQNQHPRHLA